MININPIQLYGKWVEGFALDLHTISSTLLGYDEYGHEIYDTKRSEIGELLYNLKYKSDRSVIEKIVEVVIEFARENWKITGIIECIIPVPPSNINRDIQPVVEIARGISSKLNIPLYCQALQKIKNTPQLKNVYAYNQRINLLKDAFTANTDLINGKSVLVFDDLYRSGATLNSIVSYLYEVGKVRKVYVLTLTKTRSIQ